MNKTIIVPVIAAAAGLAIGLAGTAGASPARTPLQKLEHRIEYGYPFSVGGQTYRAFEGAPRWMVSPMLPVRAVEKRMHLHGSCVLVLTPSASTHQRGWVLCRDGQVRRVKS